MKNPTSLMTAMAEKCRDKAEGCTFPNESLPLALQRHHLEWMCNRIQEHVEDWPNTKLHRWIGFIQCALLANGAIDLDEAKAMFDACKNAYGEKSDDMLDHLDPGSGFEFDIGGES